MSTVAITMAGRGQRFRDAGYDQPKYRIDVHGRSLFRWSIESLRAWIDESAQFVFLARAEDDAEGFIGSQCEESGLQRRDVLSIDGTTDGQATTALLAAPAVQDAGAPFLVYNIDTHVRSGAMRADRARGQGWIPCFPGLGDAWSFAAADTDGRVSEVREKERISPHATVGLYWFDSFGAFADLYERHFEAGHTEPAGERYIAPMYNTLIAGGGEVFIEELSADDVVALGTPEEVSRFAAAEPR